MKSIRLAYCLGLLLAASTCFAQMYTVMDLGSFGGRLTFPTGINASGQVVGYSQRSTITTMQAFRTAPDSPINPATDDLGTLGGSASFAYGINDSGQVVGYSQTPGDTTIRAFRTAPNSPINPATDDLGTLGGSSSYALGINASGQVVGYSQTIGDNYVATAFRTAPNSPINPATDDLGTLGGSATYAFGINASGQVVGLSYLTDNTTAHAFRTAPNNPINPATDDLGTLGGSSSSGNGINDFGQVVGQSTYSDTLSYVYHPFRTAANSAINPATDDLGTLGGSGNTSFASSINAYGQVVGCVDGFADPHSSQHAFLYDRGVMYDLNNLTPAGSVLSPPLLCAMGINNAGQIAASPAPWKAPPYVAPTALPENLKSLADF